MWEGNRGEPTTTFRLWDILPRGNLPVYLGMMGSQV